MHRIRTWARQKAHGPTPLVADARRVGTVARTKSNQSNRAATPRSDRPAANGGVGADGGPVEGDVAAGGGDANARDATVAASGSDAEQPAENEKETPAKPNVAKRFYLTVKDILFSSFVNVLLVFVPVGIAAHFANLSAGIVFAMNAIAIIPLAGLLSHATESVASRLGDTVGALMNVTFGNAVELIIFIALVKNEISIVQASLVGSILANLLLILGMCFLLGGLRYREQIYNSTVTQMSACLLSLSVSSLLLPTAFHASFSNAGVADSKVLELNSHAYMYESTPQEIIERESVPGPAAGYFNSSSSSESSTSSDADSDQSQSTARRIRRAIKKGRNKMHNRQPSSNSNTESPASPSPAPLEAAEPFPGSASGAAVQVEPIEGAALADLGVVADDEAEGAEAQGTGTKGEKKKHKHKKKKARTASDAGAASTEGAAVAASGVPANPATAAASSGEGRVRRVDFAMAPDVEAQTDPRPKPFSLRALGPGSLAKTLSVNVFNSNAQGSSATPQSPGPRPANSGLYPAARPQQQLRRTVSLPAHNSNEARSYRSEPRALPPIVPIVVNRTPKTVLASADGDDEEQEPEISRTTAILLLLVSTGLVALCAEFMVGSINEVVSGDSGLSEAFIGLILLPIVGNAAEHVTGVTVAMKNKMDLALGVALGSSIQIAIFVTPVVVLLGWILKKEMSLYFTLFETVSMFVSAFIVNFLVLDGRSNYLEGALLCAAYVIIAVAAFFYPNAEAANSLGGGTSNTTEAAVAVETARAVVRGMVNLVARQ